MMSFYVKTNWLARMPLSVLFAFFVPGHMLDWTVEWAWLIFQLLCAVIWLVVYRRNIKSAAGFSAKTWALSFLLFTIFGFAGTIFSSVALGFQIELKDFNDLMRYLIFVPLALFAGAVFDEKNIHSFSTALKLVVVFNLIASTAILIDLPYVSSTLMKIYADAKVQYDFGHIRLGIPFANPNFAALFFLLALSFFTAFKYSPTFIALTSISLFLTGSRSGMLSALPILVLIYFLSFRKIFSNYKIFSLFLVLHATLIYFLTGLIEAYEDFPRVFELAEALRDGKISQVDTASIRLDVISNALTFISHSPLFGVGSGRSQGLDITDSQLVAWPLMYGIPAAILMYVFFSLIFLNVFALSKNKTYRLGALVTFLSFFLMLSAGDFMKNYRLFFIIMLFAQAMTVTALKDTQKQSNFL